ncbi:unnamed protein product [Clonostachys rosea]|uniref:Uncharacterized protein n=1 Tax=Bionectria ochroleuca TaxID=29856 RepID=A0ABY6UL18_BIOOC|nr:unnamed protein product [Clonostachys rosea]
MVNVKNISFPEPHVRQEKVVDNMLPVYVNINHQTIDPQLNSLFFKLSAEIRQQIYDYVFKTEPNKGKKYPLRRSWRRPGVEAPPHIYTKLLLTCRLIYAECWALPTLNTTLIIHEGSEVDRMPSKPTTTSTHPGPLMLGLPAWQVLLFQHVHITVTQYGLESGVMEAWLATLYRARSSAAYYVSRFIETKCFDTRLMKDFMKNALLGVKVKDLTVRMNRQDWWYWDFEPLPAPNYEDEESDDWEPAPREDALFMRQPPSPYGAKSFELFHPFHENFEMTFALETWGLKEWELNDIFEAHGPLGEEAPHDKASFMIWDGKVRKESWERGKTDHGIWWMQSEGNQEKGKRIECRYLRFVQERFIDPANNPRKKRMGRAPRIAQF